jgi:hypothetical protein
MTEVGLRQCCELIGLPVRTGERRIATGRFPVPELPRAVNKRGSKHRFSTADINRYLDRAATEPRLRRTA